MFKFNRQETMVVQIKRHVRTLKGDFNAPELAATVFDCNTLLVSKALTQLKKEGDIKQSGITNRKGRRQGGGQIKTWTNGKTDYKPADEGSIATRVSNYLQDYKGEFTAMEIANHFNKNKSTISNIFVTLREDGYIVKTEMIDAKTGFKQQGYARATDKKKGCPFNLFNYRKPNFIRHGRDDRSAMAKNTLAVSQ